ncbi:hypothetical protein L461_00268 [Klebsiella pneumoniae BIDMC 25]|nr:hypothetical protein L461_00268 [Klebsiella pneumoniae BIDMC 25]
MIRLMYFEGAREICSKIKLSSPSSYGITKYF